MINPRPPRKGLSCCKATAWKTCVTSPCNGWGTAATPLARTLFLVQSNGISQWLKTSIAERQGDPVFGICLGTEVALPVRFQWQAYRSVIEAVEGPGQVPTTSPYDKSRLRWRLMSLLPEALNEPLFAPLARYLRDDDEKRKHYQLAERLADLSGPPILTKPTGVDRPSGDKVNCTEPGEP